jgi:hypothetical protein
MDDADEQGDLFPPEYVAAHKAQAAELKAEAAEHGLRFEAFFVPSIAEWVLGEVERGRFLGPSEAVFVAMQVFMELEAYPDLRKELLKREIKKSLDDPRPGIPAEEVFAELDLMAKRMAEREPPMWHKIPFPEDMDGQDT